MLIQATEDQPKLVEVLLDVWNENKAYQAEVYQQVLIAIKNVPNEGNLLSDQNVTMLRFKLTILLSLISEKRICAKFIEHNNMELFGALMKHVIGPECLRRSV